MSNIVHVMGLKIQYYQKFLTRLTPWTFELLDYLSYLVPFLGYSASSNIVTLKSGLVRGHSKSSKIVYHSKA